MASEKTPLTSPQSCPSDPLSRPSHQSMSCNGRNEASHHQIGDNMIGKTNNNDSSIPPSKNQIIDLLGFSSKHRSSQTPPSSPWLRKPLSVLSMQSEPYDHDSGSEDASLTKMTDTVLTTTTDQKQTLHRHLSLFDLVCVGIGSTIGSGIFVLCGLIAHDFAGPATCVSWAIAGLAACLSGCCYAELAGRLPSAGSSYAYAYVSMGELPAVIAAACLTLEYVASASAVARSWGDKVVEWLQNDLYQGHWVTTYLDPGYNINPMAFLVSTLSVALLMDGVKESKAVTNFFTIFKVCLVLFMSIGGIVLMDISNLKPFIPPEFGMTGVFRGTTSSFFGYIGYDEIACMAGEAQNPAKNMPRAVMLTLVLVTGLYMVAAVALTGMQPYMEVSTTSGFPEAFRSNGANIASQISAAGEIFALPIVVLITIMAQPRLQYAMAQDGLLPQFFAKMDATGNLRNGTILSGILMTVIATFVPFTYLDDLISAGILVAFSMTDSSIILLWHDSPDDDPLLCEKLLIGFNTASLFFGILLSHFWSTILGKILVIMTILGLVQMVYLIWRRCPRSSTFGGNRVSISASVEHIHVGKSYFQTPWMPFLPLLGSFVNCYLIAQLDISGIVLLVLYLSTAVIFYFIYGATHSVGNSNGWDDSGQYEVLRGIEPENPTTLLRSISLPVRSSEKD